MFKENHYSLCLRKRSSKEFMVVGAEFVCMSCGSGLEVGLGRRETVGDSEECLYYVMILGLYSEGNRYD